MLIIGLLVVTTPAVAEGQPQPTPQQPPANQTLTQDAACRGTAEGADAPCRIFIDAAGNVTTFGNLDAATCTIYGSIPVVARPQGLAAPQQVNGCNTWTLTSDQVARVQRNLRARTALERGEVLGGQTTSADAVLAGTLQMLGQIVVDRASQSAFREIRDRLVKWLCEAAPAQIFTQTCAVLRTLRLQDVASAPRVLADALFADAIAHALDRLGRVASPAEKQVIEAVVVPFVRHLLLPALRGRADLTGDDVRAAVLQLQAQARDWLATVDWSTPQGKAAAVLVAGLSAAFECAPRPTAPGAPGTGGLTTCNLIESVESLLPPQATAAADVRAAIRVATELSAAIRTTGTETAVTRAHHVLDATFEISCMAASDPGCTGSGNFSKTLTLSHALIAASLDREAADVIVALRGMLDLATTEPLSDDLRRAIRICGALLTYAETYVPSDEQDDDAEDAAEARREILESVVDEFTDRTGRDGDWVLSLGGSLGLQAGVATNFQGFAAFWGPANLRLGVALTQVPPEDCILGFHAALSAFDLAGYLTFEEGFRVGEPSVGDVIFPTLSLGVAFGRQMPAVLTLDVGYHPTHRFVPEGDDDGGVPPVPLPLPNAERRDSTGAYVFGISFGVYVPLLDLN